MKNFKKLITMALATVMAVSTMGISAFASENNYQQVVNSVNQRYDENFSLEIAENYTFTSDELSKLENFLTEMAESQVLMKTQSQQAKEVAIATKLYNTIIEPRAVFTLTHTVSGIPIKATGTCTSGTNKRFGSCTDVQSSYSNSITGIIYSQNSYSASVIDSGRSLSVSTVGEYYAPAEYGTFYDPDYTLHTEFVYTEL